MTYPDMANKTGIIMGVANKWSIAWGIAKALDAVGARIAFTCVNERFESKLKEMLSELSGSHSTYICNVQNDQEMSDCFAQIKRDFNAVDFLVHSVAFAQKEFLKGPYHSVSRSAFAETMDISCYSFTAAAREVYGMMNSGGTMLTLSYYGAEKWMPHYNVMGVAKAALECSVRYLAADFGSDNIRVNAISAGPIKTLSSMGISKFDCIGNWHVQNAPLKRLVTIDDVGRTGLYLLSDLSSGVTGEIIHVDSGYHILGMKNPDKDELEVQKSSE